MIHQLNCSSSNFLSIKHFAGDHNYDLPPNAVGGVLPPVIQGCYAPGSVVEFETVLSAHHMGHFEFFGCPISAGEVATQSCFNSNPLTFLSDELYTARKDPNYPERAYIPRTDYPGGLVKDAQDKYLFKHKYQLPSNLQGELVLIQWHYVTGNSCMDEGYDQYDWPPNFYPGNIPMCTLPLPADGRGVPEQFWNCAEVSISQSCGGGGGGENPITTTTSTTSVATGATVSTSSSSTTTTVSPQPQTCAAETAVCGPNTHCSNGCCSQYGYCGTTEAYCGACCQNGSCWNDPSPPSPPPPSPTPPTNNPPSGVSYAAEHEDSRLIAYVGNWQTCPTDEMIDAYSHIVIAFAVSYTWSPGQNSCSTTCDVASSLPICGNANRQDLIDKWRGMGKKVILSFGGAGMGGSWSGDQNNCWDYCFGREEELSTSLVNIVGSQQLDGIDIDYEYCYDVAGKQSGRCSQRTSNYSDSNAQAFLDTLTSKLRVKLNTLQSNNGYSRGRYELTHAPMDSDLVSDSKYFQILKNRHQDLDFIMPQFYNGVTKAVVDGIGGSGSGALSAAVLFGSLANDMFEGEPNKVVFGFCISDCSFTGSNTNANQAVQVMSDLKTYSNGEFACNGGAFFWVADHDVGGLWSDAVLNEVKATAGCSSTTGSTSSTTSSQTSSTNAPPTTTTTQVVTTQATTSQTTTSSVNTQATVVTTTTSSTTSSSSTTPSGELVISKSPRCGISELDAREGCGDICVSSADCGAGEWCWGVHDNYCGSIPTRTYINPKQSNVWTRCGKDEISARTFCGEPCTWQCSTPGESCQSVYTNWCDSEYTTEVGTTSSTTAVAVTKQPTSQPVTPSPSKKPSLSPVTARPSKSPSMKPVTASPVTPSPTKTEVTVTTTPTAAPVSASPTKNPITYSPSKAPITSPPSKPPTNQPVETTTTTTTTSTIVNTQATVATTTTPKKLVVSKSPRCGTSELHARETCGKECVSSADCSSGEWCWGVHSNYCGSIPQRIYYQPKQSSVWTRCGKDEISARTFCGEACTWKCSTPGEKCIPINSNYCGSDYYEV
jgi:chitinase